MRRHGIELQVMDCWICAAGNRRRHGFNSSTGIQQDVVQHEARHRIKHLPNYIHIRSERVFGASDCPLPYNSKHQGLSCAGGCCRIPSPESRRKIHCRSHANGRSPAAVKLTGNYDSGYRPTCSP